MDTFNIATGTASLLSLCFALYLHYSYQIKKAKEAGNVLLYHERLRNINATLRSSATILQTLIRRADNDSATTIELQNIARAARANIYASLVETDVFSKNLEEWKFGELLKSLSSDDVKSKEVFQEKGEDLIK